MPEYLTSSEALLTLPQKQPAHHVKGGFKSLGVGVASTAAGAAGGPYALRYLQQNFDFDWKTAGLYIGSVVLTIGGTLYGLRKLADGATSFFDPLLQHTRDGSIYRRNEGYVAGHTRFDRTFGSLIRPIDEPAHLNKIKDSKLFNSSEFFVNGATLKSRRFQKEVTEERVRNGRKVTRTRIVRVLPQEILNSSFPSGYTALVIVEIEGQEFQARTGNDSAVKYLAGAEEGNALRLRGRYEIQHEDSFDIKEVAEALLRDAA